MARPGWSARGLLQPLWTQYPGGRDGLAKAIGTTGASLSSRNSGRLTLGEDLAGRLAAELSRGLDREVSLLELGAPEEAADEAGRSLLDRLEELATALAVLTLKVDAGFDLLGYRLTALESEAADRAARVQTTSRRKRATG